MKRIIKKYLVLDSSKQFMPFCLGMIIFVVAAVLGWIKLQYGFNFLDEGFHMVESWRLAAGDHFLEGRTIRVLQLFTLFNSQLFKIYPDITLLDFRIIQYLLTLISLLVFSFVLFKVTKQYWFLPLIFSLFAFTGLDPLGANSNLNYYTYPHLFLILNISFVLLGLMREDSLTRKAFFILSGFFLWGISFSQLHLSVIAIYPVILFIAQKKLNPKIYLFTLNDLCCILAPFVLCWLIFIFTYKMIYFTAVYNCVTLITSIPGYSSKGFFNVNWAAMQYFGSASFFVLCFLFLLLKIRSKYGSLITTISFIITSILLFFIIDTSFFGLMQPYWNDWYSRPMWLSSMILSSYVFFYAFVIKIIFSKDRLNEVEAASLVIMLPCSILALTTSIFSGFGVLTAVHCAIPTIGAITLVTFSNQRIKKELPIANFVLLLAFLFPFYYQTAWSDWTFTYFDLHPSRLDMTIQDGFGKGIKTNRLYSQLYSVISQNAEFFSNMDDFIISAALTPMVHMITKRRPALDDSFIDPAPALMDYYEKSIEQMKRQGRYPVMGFIFENSPAFGRIPLKSSQEIFFSPKYPYPFNDPVSNYIRDNMELVKSIKWGKRIIVRVFVDFKRIARNNANREFLNNALLALSEIVDNQPKNCNALYNIACIHARLGNNDQSLIFLKKAIDCGFRDCNKLLTDTDLTNIKELSGYQKVIRYCLNGMK